MAHHSAQRSRGSTWLRRLSLHHVVSIAQSISNTPLERDDALLHAQQPEELCVPLAGKALGEAVRHLQVGRDV